MDYEKLGKRDLREVVGGLIIEISADKCRIKTLSNLLIENNVITEEELEKRFSQEKDDSFRYYTDDLMKRLFGEEDK